MFDLNKTVVLITGGSGHLGSSISMALAEAGATVYVFGRNNIKLRELEESGKSCGLKITGLNCDVSDQQNFERQLDAICDEEGAIDCFIGNALQVDRDPLGFLDKTTFSDGIDGTITHALFNAKAVYNKMAANKSGSIIFTSSIFGIISPNPAAYLDLGNQPSASLAAGKAAMINLTKYLASEWASSNVRVNCVSPGFFPMKRKPYRPDYINELTSRIPMGRIGKSEEVAGAYLYLASPASSYTTGQNIVVDGGYTIW